MRNTKRTTDERMCTYSSTTVRLSYVISTLQQVCTHVLCARVKIKSVLYGGHDER